MKTSLTAIILMVLCTLFTSSAQLFYKSGADKLEFNVLSIISNWNIILGIVLYGIGAVLLIIALKRGSVTVLYPIVASSYVWVAIGSSYFFGELMNSLRWWGVVSIIAGIIMINVGEKEVAV
jgi:multidrug transporter EmrE-like cation transporter